MKFSEVNVKKVEAENYLNNVRESLKTWKIGIDDAINRLVGINTRYGDLAAEINGFTPTGEWETECKEWLVKILAERNALQTVVEDTQVFLSSITEF